MAEGRMLRRKIALDKRLAQLSSDRARLTFTWCIPFLDIDGRMTGDPEVIKAMVFPFVKTINARTIEQDVAECHRIGLVRSYTANGQRYLYFPGFHKNQQLRRDREAQSDIPPPPETQLNDESRGDDLEAGQPHSGSTPGELRERSGSTPAEVKLSEEKGSEDRRHHSRSTPGGKRALPTDFELTASRREYALAQGIGTEAVGGVFEHFRDHHQQKGNRFSDWDAAWRNWVRQELKFNPPNAANGAGEADPWDSGLQVWECNNSACPDDRIHKSPNKASIPPGRRCPHAQPEAANA